MRRFQERFASYPAPAIAAETTSKDSRWVTTIGASPPVGIQEFVHGVDHHRPFAHTRGHTFDRSAAHIPDRKDAGPAGGKWYGGRHALAVDARLVKIPDLATHRRTRNQNEDKWITAARRSGPGQGATAFAHLDPPLPFDSGRSGLRASTVETGTSARIGWRKRPGPSSV